jgi:histidinol-phosphatase (PHP family)
MFSDYHTHTLYSNHGAGHPRELAAVAVEKGLLALGFSEHFPLPAGVTEPSGGSANMHWDQIDRYTQEVRAAQEEFDGKIKILLGYEVDYLPLFDDLMRANLAKYPADYFVGSIHIVDRFRSDHENWLIDYTNDIFAEGVTEYGGEAVYTRYYELIRDFARRYDHRIVGHLDMIKKFNVNGRYFDTNSEHYLDQVEATLDVLKATGKIVEINTAGLFKDIGEVYPSDKILQMILHRRLPVCLSSDAHKPEQVGRAFSATWQRLIKMGFEEVTGL